MSALLSRDAMLAQLEAMPFSDRCKQMIEWGRESVTQPNSALSDTLCELAISEEQSERLLAAMAFRGACAEATKQNATPSAKYLEVARALLFDTSAKVYGVIAGPVLRHLSDEAVQEVLQRVPNASVRVMLKALSGCGRQTVLDRAYREGWMGCNVKKREALCEVVSTEVADQWNKEEQWMLSRTTLGALSVKYPDWMAERLIRQVQEHDAKVRCEGVEEDDGLPFLLRENICTTIQVLCGFSQHHTSRGLGLMEATLHRIPQSDRRVANLISLYLSHRTLDTCHYLMRQAKHYAGVSIQIKRRVWHRLQKEGDLLVKLVKMGVLPFGHHVFRHLPRDARHRIFQDQRELLVLHNETLPVDVLQHLPSQADRQAEAFHIYHLKALEENPHLRIMYLRFLPFPQATELGAPFISNPDADLRIAMVEALTACVLEWPQYLPDLLSFCEKRNKEQDPWREAMFRGLAALPQRVWRELHYAALETLIQGALEAKDISHCTLDNIQGVLVRMCGEHINFVVQFLPRVFNARGDVGYNCAWVAKVPKRSITAVLGCIMPVMEMHAKNKDSFALDDTLRTSFGESCLRYLRHELRPLFQLCLKSSDGHVAALGAKYYLRLFPEEATSLVPQLVREDRAWLVVPAVKHIVSYKLQGPLLSECTRPLTDCKGKLVRAVCPDVSQLQQFELRDTYRWTAAQQHAYARSAMQFTDALFRHYERRRLYLFAAAMPCTTMADGIGELVAEDYPDAFTRNWAIHAMGLMRDKCSLEELLRALGDTRAKEAITALSKRLRLLPMHDALAKVAPAMASTKMSVQKEAVRFVGELGDDEAYNFLHRFFTANDADMHPDVRIALLQVLWNFADREEVWRLFETAASGDRVATALAVCKVPEKVLRTTKQIERVGDLMLLLLRFADNSVQAEALRWLLKTQRVEGPQIYEQLYTFLDRHEEGGMTQRAVQCLLHMRAPVDTLVTKLTDVTSDVALERTVDTVLSAMNRAGARKRVLDVGLHLHRRLVEHGRQSGLACQLLIACPPRYWLAQLTEMLNQKLLHPGAMGAAVSAVDHLNINTNMIEELVSIEEKELRTHTNYFMRRMGLALLVRLARNGWTQAYRNGIAKYRGDSDAWVFSDASRVRVPKPA